MLDRPRATEGIDHADRQAPRRTPRLRPRLEEAERTSLAPHPDRQRERQAPQEALATFPALAATLPVVLQLVQEVDPARADDRTPLGHVDDRSDDEGGDRAEDVERRKNHSVALFEARGRPLDLSRGPQEFRLRCWSHERVFTVSRPVEQAGALTPGQTRLSDARNLTPYRTRESRISSAPFWWTPGGHADTLTGCPARVCVGASSGGGGPAPVGVRPFPWKWLPWQRPGSAGLAGLGRAARFVPSVGPPKPTWQPPPPRRLGYCRKPLALPEAGHRSGGWTRVPTRVHPVTLGWGQRPLRRTT